MNKLHLGLAAVLGVAACGGSVVDEGTGGATGAGTSTAGTGASTPGTATGAGASTTGTGASTTGTGSGGGTSTGPCPLSPPTGSASCAGVPDQFQCTYGDSVRPDCRIAWICSNGSWETTGNTCIEPADCGSSEPGPQTVCANMGDVCTYGDSICFCGCGGGVACLPPVDWSCNGPPTTPGCPAVVPNDGTPCNVPGVQCDYGEPCTQTNAVVACSNGLWLWNTMIACAGAL
jgi:hypothetical protein